MIRESLADSNQIQWQVLAKSLQLQLTDSRLWQVLYIYSITKMKIIFLSFLFIPEGVNSRNSADKAIKRYKTKFPFFLLLEVEPLFYLCFIWIFSTVKTRPWKEAISASWAGFIFIQILSEILRYMMTYAARLMVNIL